LWCYCFSTFPTKTVTCLEQKRKYYNFFNNIFLQNHANILHSSNK